MRTLAYLYRKLNEILITPVGGWLNAAVLAAIPILVPFFLIALLRSPTPKPEAKTPPFVTNSIPASKKPATPSPDAIATCERDKTISLQAAQLQTDIRQTQVDECHELQKRIRQMPGEDELRRACAAQHAALKDVRKVQAQLKYQTCP